jgi:hypothetical protein
VCLDFTTSPATASTQPAPPVSSRMMLTLTLTLTLITLSQSTQHLKLDSAKRPKLVKVPTSQLHPTRYPCSFLHGSLGGEGKGPVLPCRSLDANVRKQGILSSPMAFRRSHVRSTQSPNLQHAAPGKSKDLERHIVQGRDLL